MPQCGEFEVPIGVAAIDADGFASTMQTKWHNDCPAFSRIVFLNATLKQLT
jgi:hypothetical protein